MILALGLLSISFICLLIGASTLLLLRSERGSAVLEQFAQAGHNLDHVFQTMTGLVLLGLFFLLCAIYIWSHP